MTERLNSRRAWVIVFVVCVCFFANEASEQRVPPVLPVLMDVLDLGIVQGGWLMSAFGWAALVSALPAAFFMAKWKPKISMLVAVGLCGAGGLLGGLTDSYGVLIVGRVLSGAGVGFVGVFCAFIIDEWFVPEKRGLPNAMLIAFYPIACIFMMNVSPALESAFGWNSIWWMGMVICIIAMILVAILLPNDRPYSESVAAVQSGDAKKLEKVNVKELLTNRSLWMVVFAFICFDIAYYGLMTYMPSVMVDNIGVPLDVATFVTSLLSVIMIPFIILNGVLLGKVKLRSRKFLPAIGLAGLGVATFFAFNSTSTEMAVAFMLIAGAFTGFISSSLFTIGPDTIPKPAYIGIIVAMVTFGQNLGVAVGPLFVGTIVESQGNVWQAAALPAAIVAIVGAVLCLLIKIKPPVALDKDKVESLEASEEANK